MTIETKIAKNGTKMYYVRDNETGKLRRISRNKADEIANATATVEAEDAPATATVETATVETNTKVVLPIVDCRTLLTWAEKSFQRATRHRYSNRHPHQEMV